MGSSMGCCNAQPDQVLFKQFCMANATPDYLPLLTGMLNAQQDQIQGEWREEAEKTGKGVIFSPGKFYYEGEIVQGKASGKGRILWDGRVVYEGAVLENKANGLGVLKLPDEEASLKGDWTNGQPALHSKMELNTHTETLTITFLELRKADNQSQPIESARAEIAFANGSVYRGEVRRKRDGQYKIEGEGTFKFADGSEYSGHFQDGKMHGKGKYFWGDTGHWFEGEYKSNFRDGNGTYYYSSSRYKSGTWKAGHLQVQ